MTADRPRQLTTLPYRRTLCFAEWGGPHSLAVAARLGDRVVRARSAVCPVPYDTEGFDSFAGMAEMNVTGFGWEIDEADEAVLARSDMARTIREFGADLATGGYWGWVDDDLAFTRPWGFDLAEIAVPVDVRYGVKDTLVPAAYGAWLVGWLVTGRYDD